MEYPRVVFTDPLGEFNHRDQPLFDSLKTLIGKARHTIEIHGYALNSLTAASKGVFDESLEKSIGIGAILRVFGDDSSQLESIKSSMSHNTGKIPECYAWKGTGLYHIKAISIDSRYVYMGSANFSDAAMGKGRKDNNAEWGTIIESNFMASELSRFSSYLIESGMLESV